MSQLFQRFPTKRVSPQNTYQYPSAHCSLFPRISVFFLFILFVLVLNSISYQHIDTPRLSEMKVDDSSRRTYVLNCSADGIFPESYGENTSNSYQMIRTSTDPSFQMSIHPPSEDVYVSGSIAQGGCWECDILRLIQKTLLENPGAYFMDVGSNIGMYSLTVASMGRLVYAFEPMRFNYAHICRSWQANQFPESHQLRVFSVAASNQVKKVSMESEKSNLGGTHIIPLVQQHPANNTGTTPTPPLLEGKDYVWTIPLDSIRDVFPKNRSVVIKMDIEGSEIDALSGAMEFLKDADILLMVVEMWKPACFHSPEITDAVLNLLREKGLYPMERQGSVANLIPLGYNWREWPRFQSTGPEVFMDVVWVRFDPNAQSSSA